MGCWNGERPTQSPCHTRTAHHHTRARHSPARRPRHSGEGRRVHPRPHPPPIRPPSAPPPPPLRRLPDVGMLRGDAAVVRGRVCGWADARAGHLLFCGRLCLPGRVCRGQAQRARRLSLPRWLFLRGRVSRRRGAQPHATATLAYPLPAHRPACPTALPACRRATPRVRAPARWTGGALSPLRTARQRLAGGRTADPWARPPDSAPIITLRGASSTVR